MKGFSKNSKQSVKYATVSSVSMPLPHSPDIPVPKRFCCSSSLSSSIEKEDESGLSNSGENMEALPGKMVARHACRLLQACLAASRGILPLLTIREKPIGHKKVFLM
ncbi:hypothetical protein ACJJTC_017768 [Scirpophaga incertulas]